jgi:hypothetical protein
MQVLKDGMQHVGKLICSNLGARMDSEPKSWRILGPHLWLWNIALFWGGGGCLSLCSCIIYSFW